MPSTVQKVFISYSQDDEALLDELVQHLASLVREGRIDAWHHRRVAAGEEWRGQIDVQLEAADLILLLVSASFIASDYCWDVEATRAFERHARNEARVIPVIVRPCDWRDSPFAELRALPKDGKAVTDWPSHDQAWLDIARSLRSALEDEATPQPRYVDDETRRLSRHLKGLFLRRKELTIAGEDTRDVASEILDVRRLLRKGPQLRAGEFLGDGRYELIEVVGQGGFATVWKAWDGEDERLVALKVLHGHYGEDRGKRERFFRGANKMAELAHPHIVRVLESEMEDEGWHFFVMEYVAGGSFEQVVLSGALSLAQRLEIVSQVGEALEFAHQRRCVHRDVKPANILVDAEGGAKLTDFDLVRADDTTGLTATRAMMGTVQFAAPEALESAKAVGPSADVYSLGATAVFAVLGDRLPPWFYRDPVRAIADLSCDAKLRQALTRAMAFDRGERFASVVEFCGALAAAGPPFLQSKGAAARTEPAVESRLEKIETPGDSVPVSIIEEDIQTTLAPVTQTPLLPKHQWLALSASLTSLALVVWTGIQLPLQDKSTQPVEKTSDAPADSVPEAGREADTELDAVPGGEVADSSTDSDSATTGKAEADGNVTAPIDLQELVDQEIAKRAEKMRQLLEGVLTDPITGMRFRLIPRDSFQMGSPTTEAERDADETPHDVTITRPFWIGETEVTQGQWTRLMQVNPAFFQQCGDDCPVETVNWFEAVAFANKLSEEAGLQSCYELTDCADDKTPGEDLECGRVTFKGLSCKGYRLPTEAEWEYAARAGTTTPFSTGSNVTTEQANYNGNYPYAGNAEGENRAKTVKVRSFDPNRWGLHDVHGNVWEWVWDWYDEYATGSATNPEGPEQGWYRVLRGGSWINFTKNCRSASRFRYAPARRFNYVGFRLVKTGS